jgi:hypothetical protein
VAVSRNPHGASLAIDAEALRPLITEIVAQVLAQLEGARTRLDERLAYSEEEAARLIGLESHQLRDERRRGRITASQIVGRRVRYLREDLVAYLIDRQKPATDGPRLRTG